MEWFSSFFVTKSMYLTGNFQAYEGSSTAVYSYEQAYETYTQEFEQYLMDIKDVTLDLKCMEDIEEWIQTYRPCKPLNPWTYSFCMDAIHDYSEHQFPELFDNDTLCNIIVRHPHVNMDIPNEREALVNYVGRIIKTELTYDVEMLLHPVFLLSRGILCMNNWRMLSARDQLKFCVAHDVSTIAEVLENQIDMLSEIIENERDEKPDDCCLARSILKDNKESLEMPTTIEDEPELVVREICKKRKLC